MRLLSLLIACSTLMACNQKPSAPKKNISGSTATAKPIQKKLPGDGSYKRFIDSFISKADIVFAGNKLDAGELWTFDSMEGPTPVYPRAYTIGDDRFLMRNMIWVNDSEQSFRNIDKDRDAVGQYFSEDSAVPFTFKGKKYAFVSAWPHNCNGTGCLIRFALIADYQYHRIHIFRTYATPDYDLTLGDIDGDDNLDFLLPDYLYSDHTDLPYGEGTETMILTVFSLDGKGYFRKKRYYGRECFIIAQCDGGIYETTNFRLTGANWATWDEYRRR